MSFDNALGFFDHDYTILNNQFVRVTGADEVRQRVRVAVWHYLEEYFLNVPNGVPWYTIILGSKREDGTAAAILRRKILAVPGVIRINSLIVSYDELLRQYQPTFSIQVQPGPGDPVSTITDEITLPVGGP